MRAFALSVLVLLAGCAAVAPEAPTREEEYRAEIQRLRSQLAAEAAERQRAARAAARREEALRRQIEAMKAVERAILDREDRTPTETR